MSKDELRLFLLDNRRLARLGRAKLIESVGVNADGEIVIIKFRADGDV